MSTKNKPKYPKSCDRLLYTLYTETILTPQHLSLRNEYDLLFEARRIITLIIPFMFANDVVCA